MPEVNPYESGQIPIKLPSTHTPSSMEGVGRVEVPPTADTLKPARTEGGSLEATRLSRENARLESAQPDRPMLPEEGDLTLTAEQEAMMERGLKRAVNVSFQAIEVADQVRGDAAPRLGGTPPPPPPPQDKPCLWLASSGVTDMNINIQTLTDSLSKMTQKDAEMAIRQRKAARESVEGEMSAITRSGEMKKHMYEELASTKFAIGAFQASMGFTALLPGMTKEGQAITQQFGQAAGTFGDAASNFIQSKYEMGLAGLDAERAFYTDRSQQLNQQVGINRDNIRSNREMLTRMIDENTQIVSKNRQSFGIGLRS